MTETTGHPGLIEDIEVLVGEMPAVGCEHPEHANSSAIDHADGDERYVVVSHPCGCHTMTAVFCMRYIKYLTGPFGNVLMQCLVCDTVFPLRSAIFDKGPANGAKP